MAVIPARLLMLLVALAANPWLLARLLVPRGGMPLTVASGCATAVAANVALPVLLHGLAIPITASRLALAHLALFVPLAVAARWRRLPLLPRLGRDEIAPFLQCAGFAFLVFPFTYLAGIDTYKWQDLATSVAVERGIPWLVHPLSLLGFTPRAYPSAQPLLLATIQILGGLGVDAGYFVMSVFTGCTGIFSSYCLGRHCFNNPKSANWFSFLFAFSPVFVRYGHWATGRGLFLALFPLFLLALLRLPRLGGLAAVPLALLLALSHKTGLIAAVLVPAAMVFAPLVPRRAPAWLTGVLVLGAAAAACLLSPARLAGGPLGRLAGFVYGDVTRFGWMAPIAALGLIVAGESSAFWGRRLLIPALVVFPVAHFGEMYGALVALPFVALGATAGLEWLGLRWPSRQRIVTLTAVLLTLAGALIVVVHRSAHATPAAIREAARFLEAHDSDGPFTVDAEESVRKQVQAYVSGCPRFRVEASGSVHVDIRRPPALLGNPRRVLGAWIDYLRNMFSEPDIDVSWYGVSPRKYTVIVNGDNARPEGFRQIYGQDGVEIYEPAGQSVRRAP